MPMKSALAFLQDEMQGEACRECRDLRKVFNAASRLKNPSRKGSAKNTHCRCCSAHCIAMAYNLREAPWQNVFLARTQLISDIFRGSLTFR